MRIFTNFREAHSEIRRDLGEMGIRVHTKTYQDKNIAEDSRFETVELQNYQYCVTDTANFHDQLCSLGVNEPWLQAEWKERKEGIWTTEPTENPGEAYKINLELWDQFREPDGRFAYNYAERLNGSAAFILNRMRQDEASRQLYISLWHPTIDSRRLGQRRVPCSLGYLLQVREDKVHITYLQRSADFYTHFKHDQYLACCLLKEAADHIEKPMGRFNHWVGSLHVYNKDLGEVF